MRVSNNANSACSGVARGRCRRTFVFKTSMRTASLISRRRWPNTENVQHLLGRAAATLCSSLYR